MPRLARLDAPGVLHHIMIRGIERRNIFRVKTDREDFKESKSEKAFLLLGGQRTGNITYGIVYKNRHKCSRSWILSGARRDNR